MKPATRNPLRSRLASTQARSEASQQLETSNLIVCSPQLGLNPNSILGGEVFDREILMGLAREGIKVDIILPKGKPNDNNRNWNITYLPLTHFPAVLGNLIYLPYLFKVYKKRKFQILRIHQPQFLGLACLFFRLFRREIKLVATYHQFRETKFGPFSKFINQKWNNIICDSLAVKNKIIQAYQISSDKITVVHNGVPRYLKPTKKDKVLVKKLNLEGKIILLFMGLFIERKNPLFLLEVLSKLTRTRPNIVLLFWGDGPLKPQIIKKAGELAVTDKIRFVSSTFGPDKNKIHNLADIFVHPSTDEGFALAPLEAMASAKPIVITNGYSAAEAVEDSVNGFLCRLNDLNHWTGNLNLLISDNKFKEKMGKASLDKVKKEFQWSKSVAMHVKVFSKFE